MNGLPSELETTPGPALDSPDGERRLGRYELVEELGRGGMANVYLARMRGPGGIYKWFAIKRVHGPLAHDEEFIRMFLDEARIAAAIQHPNVAQTFDLGEADGRYFLAMVYLHGEPLSNLLPRHVERRGRTIEPAVAASIVLHTAKGLHHAHIAEDANGQPMGLVHRDVTPHNIFITYDGKVKLTDFGVAKAAGRLAKTETGMVKGKIAYASPEQIRGEALDARSDVFALGVVLWESAVGRRLFRGTSDAETLHRIVTGYRVPPGAFIEGFPSELERIIERALAHEREERYASAEALADDLERFIRRAPDPATEAVLSTRMHEIFPAEISAKNEVLASDSASRRVSMHHLQVDVEPSHLAGRRFGEPPPTTARWALLGGAVFALLAAGAVILLSRTEGTTRVDIDSDPPGATVWIDGRQQVETTPLRLDAVGSGEHRVALELEGYGRVERGFTASGSQLRVDVPLPRSEAALGPAGPTGAVPDGPETPAATGVGPAR